MTALHEIRDGLGRAWDSVSEGWQHLYRRCKGALTHFDNKSQQVSLSSSGNKRLNWGLLSADLVDDDNCLRLTMEIPGLEKGDISVSIEDDRLTISGTKQLQEEHHQGNYHIMECAYGNFQRRIPLPASIDEAKVEASYKNGILRLNLPKKEQSSRVKIEVK
ncbi:Hsp20/alpha crystallin family protein [Thalassomonas actiniarum]|uniref:Hsp20/alpha crystallin family protein n=1 Tax=Thalassomonas actiniarum TaxID=485447 RepID=A0AAE9YLJ2_9GAMM|nr:Hsp20/alpha crystallin family protein [Thalassomonas actiniarum]WDD97669.1 Hsp20/alpha crystallin family protein [Thalassomonas actiniarum]